VGEHADAATGELNDPPAQRFDGVRAAIALGTGALVVLGCLGGWLGYRAVEQHRDEARQAEFVEAARQGALHLTTIDHATVDADIQEILDSSTGVFRDDFEKRAEPFAEVVRQAKSTSEGSVTSAGLESRDGDTAQVLVLMSVKMTYAGAPEQDPQIWRMRIGVQRSGDAAKMSDVAYVS